MTYEAASISLAREIYAILDEGAFASTPGALIHLADAGKVNRRHDPYR
jgi:hypothetical protein